MLDKLRLHFGKNSAPPAPVAAAAKHSAVAAFETEMTEGLDAGTLTGSDIIRATGAVNELLVQADPVVKARMMNYLSQEIKLFRTSVDFTSNEARQRHVQDMLSTGLALAIATPVPQSMVKNFNGIVDRLATQIEHAVEQNPANAQGPIAPDTPLAEKDWLSLVQYMNQYMMQKGDVLKGLKGMRMTIVNEPQNNTLGSVAWNEGEELAEYKNNVGSFKTVNDVPLFSVIHMHEMVHMIVENAMRQNTDMNKLRQFEPDAFVLLSICNRTFYPGSNTRINYVRHPEEVLAHSMGMRFGVRLAKLLKSDLDRGDFENLMSINPNYRVQEELDRVFPPTGTDGAPALALHEAVAGRDQSGRNPVAELQARIVPELRTLRPAASKPPVKTI